MSLKVQIAQIQAEVESTLLSDAQSVENFRIHYLGRKGIVNDLFELFKQVPNEEKKEVGQLMNGLKQAIQFKLADMATEIEGFEAKR